MRTDKGIDGVCTGAPTPGAMEVLRTQVVGTDLLCREVTYQRLHHGTRWVHQSAGWIGNLDDCFWDIASTVTSLPGYCLPSQVPDRTPDYLSGSNVAGSAPQST